MADPTGTEDPAAVAESSARRGETEAAPNSGDNTSASEKPSEREGDSCQPEALTHAEAMERVKTSLAEILEGDPFLRDLPSVPTLEEVHSLIALEHGQAMLVNAVRADGEVMPVVVHQEARVVDLKHAIQRYVSLQQSRSGCPTPLSWRHVWKRYWLYHQGQKLTDNNRRLKDYGIKNREEVTFIKRLRER